MKFNGLDYIIFIIYILSIVALDPYFSGEKKVHKKNSNDLFLAGNKLTWWAIGASLIVANISAERIIGMSGSGLFVIKVWIKSIDIVAVNRDDGGVLPDNMVFDDTAKDYSLHYLPQN